MSSLTFVVQTLEVDGYDLVQYNNELLLKLGTHAKLVAKRVGLIDAEAEDVASSASRLGSVSRH
jgi:hypothetical protein